MFPQISSKVAIFYFKVEGATRPLKVKELKALVVIYMKYLFYYFSDLHDTNNFVWTFTFLESCMDIYMLLDNYVFLMSD